MAMDAGCHVFVEKPMALSASEAEKMLASAKENGVFCCADHNMVYDPMTRKVLDMVTNGDIGRVVTVEAGFRFDTNRYPAVKADGAQYCHWIYSLYGGPLQDLMPHPASLIAEFIDEIDEIHSVSEERGCLPEGWPDEVRVLIRSQAAFGYINISLHERPDTTTLKVVGDGGSINANYFSGIITTEKKSVLPRAANRALASYKAAWQNFRGGTANIFNVLLGRFDKGGGTPSLIDAFYEAIRTGADSPISSQKLLNTVKLTNAVWPAPCSGHSEATRTLKKAASVRADKSKPTVLVTGASGFIGTHLLKKLEREGHKVRALVRPNSINAGRFIGSRVEVFQGDLTDESALSRACEGIQSIYHAGSAMSGDWKTFEDATISGTNSILAAAQNNGVERFVHLSTLAVYELLDKARGQIVEESDGYQNEPRKMGAYAYCKIEAEKLVKEASAQGKMGVAIVRPGMVIGEGGYPFFPHLGFNLGDRVFLLIGKGNVVLPFTYVENTVDGIYLAGTKESAVGGIYNLVDDASVTAAQYIDTFISTTGVDAKITKLPYIVPYMAMAGYEFAALLGIVPKGKTSCAQLKWKQAPVTYSTTRAKEELGWTPAVGMDEAMERTFESYAAKYL
jgi:nucleoside-diphosphate-sugar epimerase/predicted dehydrogenase